VASAENFYQFETAAGCLIITLLPELNDKQWADIEKVGTEIVDRLNQSESPRLVLDLTRLGYMGSAMVALIVRLYKAVNGRGGRMVVVNTHELVFEVLKLAGLTKLWTIVDSREKGYTALGVKARDFSRDLSATAEGGTGILIAGVVGTLGAIVGLALELASPHLLSPTGAKLIEVGFAALGIVVGTMILAKQTGMRRNMGIAFLAICVLVILGGAFAGSRAPAPAPAGGSSSGIQATTKSETANVAAAATPQGAEVAKTQSPAQNAPTANSASKNASQNDTAVTAASANPEKGSGKRKRKDD
jgi:anti-anti-sigma factor